MKKIKFLLSHSKNFRATCLIALTCLLFALEDFANGCYMLGAAELLLVVMATSCAKDEYDEIK